MKSLKKHIYKPLILLIGGSWSSGKSTVAINLAHHLEVANIIHTDIIRCSCREILNNNLFPSLHLSTYESWKSIGPKCTKHTLSEGFLEQCKIIYPSIKRCIDEAIDFGKDTIIEGMHLHPFLYKCVSKNVNCHFFWLSYSYKYYKNRINERCMHTYKNRNPKKYLESQSKEKIMILNKILIRTASESKVNIIDNTNYNADKSILTSLLAQ